MISKELVKNELLKELIGIRIDTLWKMNSMRIKGLMPQIGTEDATGEFDSMGALFIPGGLILRDSRGRPISSEGDIKGYTPEIFRDTIRNAMKYDNATLLFDDSIQFGVNLDNGFFCSIAPSILERSHQYSKRTLFIRDDPPNDVNIEDIAKSNCPHYVDTLYGSKTLLSSCVSVGLTHQRGYYDACKDRFGLVGDRDRQKEVWNKIKNSKKPIIASDGETVLAPASIVVCHNTRHKEGINTGITRILGYGKFGEFATLTLEDATTDLLHEVDPTRTEYTPDEIVAEYNDTRSAVVLRLYPPTTPGKRLLKGVNTSFISPQKDLGIDVEKIECEARERYSVR
jgi:hypothetical protein